MLLNVGPSDTVHDSLRRLVTIAEEVNVFADNSSPIRLVHIPFGPKHHLTLNKSRCFGLITGNHTELSRVYFVRISGFYHGLHKIVLFQALFVFARGLRNGGNVGRNKN